MIYEKYKARISKIAKFLLVVRRYRILIMSIILTVLAITTVLLSTNGIVYGDSKCPSTIAYGQTLEYEAKGFLTKVHFEFYNPTTKTWSTEQPTQPGKYKVRAVSQNIFGDKKYGEVHDFTIAPKEVFVKVSVSEIEYGALPPVTADLVDEGSTVSCSLFDYIGLGSETVKVYPKAEGVKILDKDGEDITKCYTVKGEITDLKFTARLVVLSIPDVEHVYDGQIFTSEQYVVEEGSFLPTDTVIGTFTGSVETAGEQVNNEATFKVYRGEADVTSYYKIVCGYGKLSVVKRPLLLQTNSATHTYDGTVFSAPDYTISEDTPIPDGHKVVVDDYAKLTEIGSVANTLTVRILDANDIDVTENYEISFPKDSVLTVVERELALTSEGAEKFYDGDPLTHHVITVDDGYSLADGQYYVATWTGTLTEHGDVANEFTVKIYIDDGDGDDTTHGAEVTSNYKISYTYGRLVVGYTQITFKTASAEKQYDATPLKAESYVELMVNGVVAELPEAFVLVLSDFAEITEVGFVANTATYKIVSKDNLDEEHNQNYQVTPEWGELKITQREISVWGVDAEKIYDGTPLESNEVEWDIQLPADHVLTADLIGSQTYFGTSVNELLEENISITYNGQDVTPFFTFVGIQNSSLTITTRYLYLTTHSHTWIYDGLEHKDDGTDCNKNGYDNDDLKDGFIDGREYYLLPNGHNLVVDGTTAPAIMNYAQSGMFNTLSFFVYVNVNGVDTDVTADNFTIILNEVDTERGKLYIDKRELSVLSDSDAKVYDGTVLTAENYQIVSGDLALNQTIIVDDYHSGIVDVQVVDNEWQLHIEDQNGLDVTDNYAIDKQCGTLEITPRYIWITTHEHSWMYDGAFHSDMGADCVLGGYGDADLTVGVLPSQDGTTQEDYKLLASGQTLSVATATSVKNVNEGQVENELAFHVLDANNQDVTKNYVFRYTNQKIWITRRPIEVQANDVSWIYDGKAHYDGDGTSNCAQYTNAANVNVDESVGKMRVVDGETIALDRNSFTNTAKITDVGDIVNNPAFVVLYDGTNRVSDNYTITVLSGKLMVTPRDIWVTTHNVTWEYDGRGHYEKDGYHTFQGYGNADLKNVTENGTHYQWLVSGHTLEIDSTKAQAAVLYVADSGTPNELELCVYANGVSVNDNYTIRYTYGTLTITPRKVTITAKSDKTVYNGLYQTMPQKAIEDDIYAQLAPNQTLYDIQTLGVNEKNANTYVHEIVQDSAVIHDWQGKDVTVNYAITYKNGTYTIEKRKINILTHDHTWKYDAEVHYDDCVYGEADLTLPNSTYFNTLDELPVGSHTLKTVTYTPITNVWQSWTSGAGNNAMTFDVLDNNGIVVTSNYTITYTKGKLIITPLEIRIIGDSLTEMYDGTEKVIHEDMYTIDPGLLSTVNHTHTVARLDVSGAKRTDYGETLNTVYPNTLIIVDEGANDVTGNYIVVDVEHGKLTITKRPIYVVKTHTCIWEYDGVSHRDGDGAGNTSAYSNAELLNNQITCFGLVLDHKLKPIAAPTTATIQNVLESGKENRTEFAVFYADGSKNTNYDVHVSADCNFGTLHVTPRAATIVSGTAEKVYDGTPLICDKIESAVGVLENLGHYVKANATGSQTNAGESKNTFDPKVFDANDNDVTSNYTITKVEGDLKVNKRPIVVISDSAEKVYDGTPLNKHSCTTKYTDDRGIEYDGLVLDHVISPQYTGSQTFAGKSDNVFTTTVNDIRDGNGNSMEMNYTIIGLEYGDLVVKQRKITIEPSSDKKVYDATPLIAHNQYVLLDETTLARTDTMTVATVYTEIINVGKKDHVFTNPNNPTVKIVWVDGVTDVTYCYDITYSDDPGVLEITPCEVKIQTSGAEKPYDGTPLTNTVFNVTGLPSGHTYKNMYTIGSQTYPGTSPNIVNSNWQILDANGIDVTNSGNFEYIEEYGTLKVLAVDIIGMLAIKPVDLIIDQGTTLPTQFSGSVEDANNGASLWVLQRSGGCSYTATINTVYGAQGPYTEISDFHLFDVQGNEISYKYKIEYHPGKVEYRKNISINIELPFKEKVYDGTPLFYDEVDEANMTIEKPSDVDVCVNLAGMSKTDAGTLSKDELMQYTRVMRNGIDITDSCTVDFGTYNLVVRPREIIVETQSASKIYDGTPLKAQDIAQPINLLKGHRLMGQAANGEWIELKAPVSITGIGKIENFLDYKDCKVMDEITKKDVTLNYAIIIKQGILHVKG